MADQRQQTPTTDPQQLAKSAEALNASLETDTPARAPEPAAHSADSALRMAFDSLSLRTPDSRQQAGTEAEAAAAAAIFEASSSAARVSTADASVPAAGLPSGFVAAPVHAPADSAAEHSAETAGAAPSGPTADQAAAASAAAAGAHTASRGAGQAAAIRAAAYDAAVSSPEPTPAPAAAVEGEAAATSTPEPATPPSSDVSLVIPATAISVAEATPSAPDAEPRIKVKLSRDEAAALAEQLAAVSLGAPPTPPTAAILKDTLVGLVYDRVMEDHIGPESHWERPQRTAELFKLVTEQGLAARCWTLPPRQATDAELLLAHTAEHIASVEAGYDPAAEPAIGDIYYSAGTATAARTAAGSTIAAAQWIMEGDAPRSALAVVRPPGHHAECSCAMGFCFFNNVALAALSLLQQGLERVLIFDWDVHHGNGTEHLLQSDPRVMYMSLHRGNGFYPNTGAATDIGVDAGQGFTVNVPWSKGGAGDTDYLAAWELVLGPIAAAYAPQAVLVSAGFDAAEGDPLGGCRLTPHGYGKMTQKLAALSGGRILLALEGGYNTRATSEAAAACLEVLLGGAVPAPDPFSAPRPLKETQAALQATAEAHAPFWPVLEPISGKEAFAARWAQHLASIQTPRNTRKTRGGNSKHIDFVVYT